MTIDEAIARERQQAKEQRNHIGTWDDEYSKKCEVYAEEHEQLAEWLEELKAYKETKCNKSVYLANKSIDMIDAVNKGYADGYNKAIDDFAEKLKRENKETIPTHSGYCRMSFDEVVEEIAEQLKGRWRE